MGSLNGLSVEEKEKVKEILSRQWLKCNKQIEIIEKEVGIRISRWSLFYYRKKFKAYRKCKSCDMEINDATSNRNMHGRYCSTICRLNDRIMECKECKGLFEPSSGRSKNDWLKRNIAYFCSKECRIKYLKEHKEVKMKICPICNIKFKDNKKYCSDICKKKALKEKGEICSRRYYESIWTKEKVNELLRLYKEEDIKLIVTLSQKLDISQLLILRKLIELGLKGKKKFRVITSLNNKEEKIIKDLLLKNGKLPYKKQIEIISENIEEFKPTLMTFIRLRQKFLGSNRCRGCGEIILNRSGGEKWCSEECKLIDKGRVCKQCGKKFIPLCVSIKFCSKVCYREWENLIVRRGNEELKKFIDSIINKSPKYIFREVNKNFDVKIPYGTLRKYRLTSPLFKKRKSKGKNVNRKCLNCGKEFVSRDYKYSKLKCCSLECSLQYRRKLNKDFVKLDNGVYYKVINGKIKLYCPLIIESICT